MKTLRISIANVSLVTLALAISGCTSAPSEPGNAGSGGSTSSGTGGARPSGGGGSSSAGSGGSSSGSGGGTASGSGGTSGSGGSAGGTGGTPASGGTSGGTGGSPGTGGTTSSSDGGADTGTPATDTGTPSAGEFKLEVKGFTVMDGKNYFPASATAPGGQHSPAMEWPGAPATAKSFAVSLVDNSEQQAQGGKSHWVLWNIPATTKGLAADLPKGSPLTMPAEVMGAQQVNLVGAGKSYFGPGAGGSRPYRFVVWALDVADLPVNGANLNTIIRTILPAHKIASASFDGIGYK